MWETLWKEVLIRFANTKRINFIFNLILWMHLRVSLINADAKFEYYSWLLVIMLLMLPCVIINFKPNEANNDVRVIIIKLFASLSKFIKYDIKSNKREEQLFQHGWSTFTLPVHVCLIESIYYYIYFNNLHIKVFSFCNLFKFLSF